MRIVRNLGREAKLGLFRVLVSLFCTLVVNHNYSVVGMLPANSRKWDTWEALLSPSLLPDIFQNCADVERPGGTEEILKVPPRSTRFGT